MIPAIVLAAGKSERMEKCKQLLEIDGQPMIRKVVSTVLKSMIDNVYVMLGYRAADVSSVLPSEGVETIYNPDFEEGMSSSIRSGVKELSEETDAFLVVLGDQPFLESETINKIISEYVRTEADIVAPFYKGIRGNPVLLDYSLKKETMNINGDIGAREILEKKKERISRADVSSPSILIDINTLKDFKKIRQNDSDMEAFVDEK